MKRWHWIVALLLAMTTPMAAQAGSKSKRERALAEMKKHIEANVPDKSDFDAFLRRDLIKYFNETTGKRLNVDYELLREKPFQAGKRYPSAYPRFYLWIKLYENNTLVNKGAAKVAAIEKKRFKVTTFADKKEIEQKGCEALGFFPILLCMKIMDEKMKE
jgi:hypothetical protein